MMEITKTKIVKKEPVRRRIDIMGLMKSRNSFLSPRSLIIHTIGIGAAVWLGKVWGENEY